MSKGEYIGKMRLSAIQKREVRETTRVSQTTKLPILSNRGVCLSVTLEFGKTVITRQGDPRRTNKRNLQQRRRDQHIDSAARRKV